MSQDKGRKPKFTSYSLNHWVSRPQKTAGYVGTIVYTDGTGYILTIAPGGYTSTFPTLKLSKNDFRKFLHDKS
jgi:hypothetical protein